MYIKIKIFKVCCKLNFVFFVLYVFVVVLMSLFNYIINRWEDIWGVFWGVL